MKKTSPVFIIGGSRTGSEMLKPMLSASEDLDFVDELFLYFPRRLHKDLYSNIKGLLDNTANSASVERLLDVLYSGVPYGWFWTNIEEQLDRGMLASELKERPLSMHNLFDSVMKVDAKMRNKNGIGAKFPMHFSDSRKLIKWYPNCRLIHTTRNPKAVYASQSAKYITGEESSLVCAYKKFQQFVHVNIQTWWTARMHQSLQNNSNYLLVRYEDIIKDPQLQVTRICQFLDIEFVAEMLEPQQYGSSFTTIGGDRGIHLSSLEKWRTKISPFTAMVIDRVHPFAYRMLGYLPDGYKDAERI